MEKFVQGYTRWWQRQNASEAGEDSYCIHEEEQGLTPGQTQVDTHHLYLYIYLYSICDYRPSWAVILFLKRRRKIVGKGEPRARPRMFQSGSGGGGESEIPSPPPGEIFTPVGRRVLSLPSGWHQREKI